MLWLIKHIQSFISFGSFRGLFLRFTSLLLKARQHGFSGSSSATPESSTLTPGTVPAPKYAKAPTASLHPQSLGSCKFNIEGEGFGLCRTCRTSLRGTGDPADVVGPTSPHPAVGHRASREEGVPRARKRRSRRPPGVDLPDRR